MIGAGRPDQNLFCTRYLNYWLTTPSVVCKCHWASYFIFFCFSVRKAEMCCGVSCWPHCNLRQIYQKLFISIRNNSCWLAESFIFTGGQGVCLVPMETPASGKSRLDPGCQFGGRAVSRFIFQIATWEAQYLKIPLSHKWREICVKVVQGVFKAPWSSYWGYDGIWCRCWFKPSYPRSSSSTMETLLMKTLFLCRTHSGQLKHSCQILVFIG